MLQNGVLQNGPLRNGHVEQFDEHAGFGQILDTEGQRWFFHCTVLVDGSRTIDQGTLVGFHVGPGGPGRWEATAVESLGS